ncbi:MAG: AraC family transcriptional regulator [Actinocatenispora sp.]
MTAPQSQPPAVRLDAPPQVVGLGVGVHGTTRRTDLYRLPDLWQLHLYGYHAELTVDGVEYPIRPGSVSLVPPGAQARFRYEGRSEHRYVHLRMGEVGAAHAVPLMQDAGAETPILSNLLEQAIAAWPSTPAQAVAEVWTVLWRLVRLTGGMRPHQAVGTAIAYIEAHLAGPLTVPEVARAAGISHNHLIRLFHAATGDTVVAYIRRRRLDRARHLLRHSTLPIATVAASVGIGDLQAFNKACRHELGAAPRAIRAGTG